MNMNIKLNPTQQATLEYVTGKTGWSPPALIELLVDSICGTGYAELTVNIIKGCREAGLSDEKILRELKDLEDDREWTTPDQLRAEIYGKKEKK